MTTGRQAQIDPLEGWPHDESPFHPGEEAVQSRSGLRDRIAQVGPLLIRGAMPDEHRELLEQLPFVLLGTIDGEGRPWASILVGPPGFVRTPDAQTLRITALPAADDPAAPAVRAGGAVGLLSIEPRTRRRNRVNGTVVEVSESGFVVHVRQSFGNCPKYIQARDLLPVDREPGVSRRFGGDLPAEAAALIRGADTFFIASASTDAGRPNQAPSGGADVSHRGGKPSFVRVGAEGGHAVLTIPDFVGNFLFNTLGNLEVNPRAGLLFVDFESGDLLQVTGHTEVVWEGAEVDAFAGAQRLLKFHLDEGRWRPGAVALRGTAVEYSRHLRATGSWEEGR